MSRGERFESEARALQIFGVAPDPKVRKLWVNGHLKDFAPAGLGVPGEPSLPFYLLERGEPTVGGPGPSYHPGQTVGVTRVLAPARCGPGAVVCRVDGFAPSSAFVGRQVAVGQPAPASETALSMNLLDRIARRAQTFHQAP